jgi:hypothetical protein
MRANNISLTVDSGAVLFGSNAFVNSAILSIGNTTANVTVNTTHIVVGNSTVNVSINSTAFSRQANGATNLGPEGSGVSLSTLQSQITGNASTAFSNAIANSANATNITSGTIGAGFLPATVVNTSGAFTITGVHTLNANLFINTANHLLIGNVTVNAVANQTTFAIFNGSSNVVANASTINFAGGVATINSTAYSRQSNGATNLGPEGSGVSLSTLQSQITGNAATAYTNATSFVTGNNWTSTANLTFNGTNNVFTNLLSANGGIFRLTGNGPAYWLQQDGTGRTHWYWNTSGGGSPTFAFAGEDASSLSMSSQLSGAGGVFFHRSASGVGKLAGDAITWTTTFSVDLNSITWKGNSIAVANGSTYNLTANNASFLGGTAAASYQLNSTLSANVVTMTANDSNRLGTQLPAFYTNATNITTGTLPWAQAPAGTVNTSGAFTFTAVQTFNQNLIVDSASLSVGNTTANVTVNTTHIVVGNSTVNVSVNSTVFSGTSNNATNLGGTDAASYALTSSLSSYAALAGASFTGNLTCEAGLFEKAIDVGGGTAFNMNLGTYFYKTISGSTTFTVSNVPASGTVASFTVELTNGGSAAITWMTGTKWASGVAPSLTASGKDILVFTTRDGGTNWYGSAAIINAA